LANSHSSQYPFTLSEAKKPSGKLVNWWVGRLVDQFPIYQFTNLPISDGLLIPEEGFYPSPVFIARIRFDKADAMPGEQKPCAFGLDKYQVLAISSAGIRAYNVTGLRIGYFIHFGQKGVGAG
jgi:hypothetical protein